MAKVKAVEDINTQDGAARKQVVRRYGNWDLPGSSELVMRLGTRQPLSQIPNAIPGGAPKFRIQDFYAEFGLALTGGDVEYYRVEIDDSLIHNCVCHKLAALCFFEWSPKDGHYVRSLLIDGEPNTSSLVIGRVSEIGEID